MPIFGRSTPKADSKAGTEEALRKEGITEYRRPLDKLSETAATILRAQVEDEEWDLADDQWAEAAAMQLAAQAKLQAELEKQRREVERQRRIQELMAEQLKARELIARQERVERTVVRAASTLRSLAQTSDARWDNLVREINQANQLVNQIYLEARCWRCGAMGRLPVEDVDLFSSPAPPARPAGGAQYDKAVHASRQLIEARRVALQAWRRYNDRRLETEKLRLDANYHANVSDRYAIERCCEVCGSEGIFHCDHIIGDRDEGGDQMSLYARWKGAMHGLSAYVSPWIGFNKWVPVEKLDRNQAKAWLQAPRQGAGSNDSWRKYDEDKKIWDEKVKDKLIAKVDFNRVAYWGKEYLGSHQEYIGYGNDRKAIWVREPERPTERRNRTLMDWPTPEYWTDKHPKHWKGGPGQDLHIKAGVVYAPEKQDPLSKEPRQNPPPLPPHPVTTLEQLRDRQSFWAGLLARELGSSAPAQAR